LLESNDSNSSNKFLKNLNELLKNYSHELKYEENLTMIIFIKARIKTT